MKKTPLTNRVYNKNKTFPLQDRHTAMYLHAKRMELELEELTLRVDQITSKLDQIFCKPEGGN
jgi:hypothetical protein